MSRIASIPRLTQVLPGITGRWTPAFVALAWVPFAFDRDRLTRELRTLPAKAQYVNTLVRRANALPDTARGREARAAVERARTAVLRIDNTARQGAATAVRDGLIRADDAPLVRVISADDARGPGQSNPVPLGAWNCAGLGALPVVALVAVVVGIVAAAALLAVVAIMGPGALSAALADYDARTAQAAAAIAQAEREGRPIPFPPSGGDGGGGDGGGIGTGIAIGGGVVLALALAAAVLLKGRR